MLNLIIGDTLDIIDWDLSYLPVRAFHTILSHTMLHAVVTLCDTLCGRGPYIV